jgi:hypothetical protein
MGDIHEFSFYFDNASNQTHDQIGFANIFCVTELARLVLRHLTGKDLLNAQQTCHLLHDHVHNMKLDFMKGGESIRSKWVLS